MHAPHLFLLIEKKIINQNIFRERKNEYKCVYERKRLVSHKTVAVG